MRVAVMTDTNSGISVEEGVRLGVHVMPMPVLIDGETYYEGVTLTHEDFYRSQEAGRAVSTSQPAPSDVLSMWDKLLAEDYEGRVQVVNNQRISVPQRSSVMDALCLARAGRTAEEIKRELERTGLDCIIYIGVDTLEYLKRGGRITPAAAAMGSLLQLKPLLKIEGERLDAFAKVRGRKACQERLVGAMQKSVEEFRQKEGAICVGAAGTFRTPEEGERWRMLAEQTFPGEEIRYDPLALSIGCHTGPGAFGMAVWRRADLG